MKKLEKIKETLKNIQERKIRPSQVRTQADLLSSLASAARNKDLMAVDQLEQIVRGWMIDKEEKRALLDIIDAVADMTTELRYASHFQSDRD